jgi:hypothetical protein
MIAFSCPHCNRTLKVQDHLAGRGGKCPGCKGQLTVPVGTSTKIAPIPPSSSMGGADEPTVPPSNRRDPATPTPPLSSLEEIASGGRQFTGSGLTPAAPSSGTFDFLAPAEQAQGALDARSDLFSLGCVLYRMTTGKPAFRGADLIGTLAAILTIDPPPPHEVDPAVPPRLSRFIMKLLAKEPDERPASAQATAEELEKLEAGVGERPRKPRRKQATGGLAWLLFVGAGITVAVAAIVLLLLWRSPPKTDALQAQATLPVSSAPPLLTTTASPAPTSAPSLPPPPPKTEGPPPVIVARPRRPPQLHDKQLAAAEVIIRAGGAVGLDAGAGRSEFTSFDMFRQAFDENTLVWSIHFSNIAAFDENVLRALEAFDELESVLLNHCAVGRSLHHLRSRTTLKRLALMDCRLEGDSLAPLAELKELQSIGLPGSNFTDAMLAAVMWPAKLTELTVERTSFGNAALAAVAKLPSLNQLALIDTKVTDEGLQALADCRSLTLLDLRGTATGDKGLRHCRGMAALARVGLGLNTTNAGVAELLASHDTVTSVLLLQGKVTGAGLKAFGAAKQLRQLELVGLPIHDEDLAHLRGLSDLRILDLTNTPTGDKGLDHLSGLPLASLRLGLQATDAGLVQLAKIATLRSIHAGGGGGRVTRKGAENWHAERKKLGLPDGTVTGAFQ